MSFKVHIADQINKANSMLGIIKRNFRDIKQDAFILYYVIQIEVTIRPAAERIAVWVIYPVKGRK